MDPKEERAELFAIYAGLDAEIAAIGPRCEASGRCCRFAEYGHTLFLSALEAEALFEPGIPPGARLSAETCPYQVGGLCTARERRPLGCRSYFCDPTFAEAMPAISERWTQRLKELHERSGRAWDYRPLHRHFPPGNDTCEIAAGTLRIAGST
ncbi:MAG TPA: hypothetical protein VNC50_06055 [Planctomycetia bacterium]|nr:hypothetical protein [Planctomycetia bacterium]